MHFPHLRQFHPIESHVPIATAPAEPRPLLLRNLTEQSAEFRHLLTHFLLPVELLVEHGIDPITWKNKDGEVMVHVAHEGDVYGLRLLNDIDRRDPLIEVEMADTVFGRIEVTWIGVNDPNAPRFDIDHTPDGHNTLRGTAARNLQTEAAALVAGLSPGQVRAGLRILPQLLADVEQFMAAMHQYEYEVEPLYYHNAILFERAGFHYLRGRQMMERIHEGFAPGGVLAQRLDNSSPFRRLELANTIRGRSWAIHDGILDETWDGIKLVKRIGVKADVHTAPEVGW